MYDTVTDANASWG